MFSLNDVDTLLEIKDFLDQGINIAGIKKIYALRSQPTIEKTAPQTITDAELRKILRDEMLNSKSFDRGGIRQGDLSRFFK